MSKNPVSKSKPVKRNEPMHNALKFFLAGCVAEIYLLVIRRFYVNGTANELLACDAALPYLMAAGAAVAVIGLVLGIVWRQQTKRRWIGWSVFAAGVFLGGSAWMIRTFYDSALTFLCVVVPVVMLLGILWNLYDRECSWSLTILGASLIALWVCRRVLDSIFLGTYVRIAAVVYIVVLIVAAFLTNKADKNGGKLGNLQVLTAGADPMPIYAACGLSVVALAIALFSSTIAYYAMWALAIVVFALAGVLHGQAALIDPQPPFGHSEGGAVLFSRVPTKGPPFRRLAAQYVPQGKPLFVGRNRSAALNGSIRTAEEAYGISYKSQPPGQTVVLPAGGSGLCGMKTAHR